MQRVFFLCTFSIERSYSISMPRGKNTPQGLRDTFPDASMGQIQAVSDKMKEMLRIPRRPKWNYDMSAEQLQRLENAAFISWRRNLALFQERNVPLVLTPYELNLDMWRELWRVIERSHLLVQIVDARNPLLFFCEDLMQYLGEHGRHPTPMLLLLNKADLLTSGQREAWLRHFTPASVDCIFYSSTQLASRETYMSESPINTTRICSPRELIALFETFRNESSEKSDLSSFNVGLVGYPNVGKSSTINSLLTSKRVRVGATPGKTKHLQTIFLTADDDTNQQEHISITNMDEGLASMTVSLSGANDAGMAKWPSKERTCPPICLVDCPGLVFPNFATTRAELVVNGILPIDQLRDSVAPCDLVASRIPRNVLEETYVIVLPPPFEGEDPRRPPTGQELLMAYATARGFGTDFPRAARIILKDYVAGSKICYVHMPPGHQYLEGSSQVEETSSPKQMSFQIALSNFGRTEFKSLSGMDCTWAACTKGKFASHHYTRGLAVPSISTGHKQHYKRK